MQITKLERKLRVRWCIAILELVLLGAQELSLVSASAYQVSLNMEWAKILSMLRQPSLRKGFYYWLICQLLVRSSITILIHVCFPYYAISEIRDHTIHTCSNFDRSMTLNTFIPQILWFRYKWFIINRYYWVYKLQIHTYNKQQIKLRMLL